MLVLNRISRDELDLLLIAGSSRWLHKRTSCLRNSKRTRYHLTECMVQAFHDCLHLILSLTKYLEVLFRSNPRNIDVELHSYRIKSFAVSPKYFIRPILIYWPSENPLVEVNVRINKLSKRNITYDPTKIYAFRWGLPELMLLFFTFQPFP